MYPGHNRSMVSDWDTWYMMVPHMNREFPGWHRAGRPQLPQQAQEPAEEAAEGAAEEAAEEAAPPAVDDSDEVQIVSASPPRKGRAKAKARAKKN